MNTKNNNIYPWGKGKIWEERMQSVVKEINNIINTFESNQSEETIYNTNIMLYDVGGGYGHLSKHFNLNRINYVCIDKHPIEDTNIKFPFFQHDFLKHDIENLESHLGLKKDNTMNIFILQGVLEYIDLQTIESIFAYILNFADYIILTFNPQGGDNPKVKRENYSFVQLKEVILNVTNSITDKKFVFNTKKDIWGNLVSINIT